MSITFDHNVGQCGNKLFVCIMASIIARKNNLQIRMPNSHLVDFHDTSNDVPDVKDRVIVKGIVNTHSHVHLAKGYYQNASFYVPYQEDIRNTILSLPLLNMNCDDIVMHIRLDGFNHQGHNSHIIHHRWYTSILDSLNGTYKRLYIVMDTKSGRIFRKQWKAKQSYIDMFKAYDPIIVSSTAREDFEFIRSFKTIICSNSTFCWWSSFLSDAKSIYIPPIWESKGSKLSEIPNAIITTHVFGYINIETMQEVDITYQ